MIKITRNECIAHNHSKRFSVKRVLKLEIMIQASADVRSKDEIIGSNETRLCRKGESIKAVDNNEATILHWATHCGSVKVCQEYHSARILQVDIEN